MPCGAMVRISPYLCVKGNKWDKTSWLDRFRCDITSAAEDL